MRYTTVFVALFLAIASVSFPAHACMGLIPIELADVERANVVVVGRIANYKLVLDPVIRQQHANSEILSPETLESYKSKPGFITDYATFDVLVDEVLMGEAPQTLAVTWGGSWFAVAEKMPPGPFLIALQDTSSRKPALPGTVTIYQGPQLGPLTVMQGSCSGPFIFEAESDEADSIRKMLKR